MWGSWLNTFGSYMFITLRFKGEDIGAVYSTLGIAAVITSTLFGIVADKWISAKWIYAACHFFWRGNIIYRGICYNTFGNVHCHFT